ncbi:hypothetical protein KGY79_12975 [Candidatus Bipolaricaulota bacterium]|nr:hypothetical protein [Candidatus Bipolaricaulota bacterium]
MKNPVWSKNAFFALLFCLLVASLLTGPTMADEQKVTVPIDKVVKTDKLSATQSTKQEVTVPISWVSDEYLEKKGHKNEEKTTNDEQAQAWETIYETGFKCIRGNLSTIT